MKENLKDLINDIYSLNEEDWYKVDKASNEYLVRKTFLNRTVNENLNIIKGILKSNELAVLCSRYGLFNSKKMTFAEIGKKYSLSRQRAQQLNARGLKKIKQPILSENFTLQ